MPQLYTMSKTVDIAGRYATGLVDQINQPTLPNHSLIILRNFGNAATDQQAYVPHRFLRGLIPEPLLDDYVFWQVKIIGASC